jgi:ribosomal protein L44E
MPKIKYSCVKCGDEYPRSKLIKAFGGNHEIRRGYNNLYCPKCKRGGPFEITIYYSEKERKKIVPKYLRQRK